MKISIEGIEYKSMPAIKGSFGCEGCAGRKNILCRDLPDCRDIIWVEVPGKGDPKPKLSEEFPWGEIQKLHVIGPYTVTEYIDGVTKDVRFKAPITAGAYPTLDEALIAHLCYYHNPEDSLLPELAMWVILGKGTETE